MGLPFSEPGKAIAASNGSWSGQLYVVNYNWVVAKGLNCMNFPFFTIAITRETPFPCYHAHDGAFGFFVSFGNFVSFGPLLTF